jgi:hypothetical protein
LYGGKLNISSIPGTHQKQNYGLNLLGNTENCFATLIDMHYLFFNIGFIERKENKRNDILQHRAGYRS